MTFAPITMKADLAEELTKELNIEEVFGFDVGSMHIGFDETTVVSWIIMVGMAVLCFFLTRNLKVEGKLSKRQLLLELAYTKGEEFFKGLMGEKIHNLIPWLMSMAIFIGISNMIGMLGFKPPTKSMQVTGAMALTSIFLIEFTAFKDKGIKGRLRAFTKPISLVTPINILEVFTKPLSLCMRLFGNVLAAFTIMKVAEIALSMIMPPIIVPTIMSLYFDIFDGLLQAYIFVFLTALYLEEAVEPIAPPKTKEQKRLEKEQKKQARLEKKQIKLQKKQAKKA
ncbi:MAG: FoF1 ATP synthase subunit a [Eubacterium sp.]